MADRSKQWLPRWTRIAVFLVAVLACVFAWVSDRPRRQKRVIEQTHRLGGFVSHDHEHDPTRPPPKRDKHPLVSWLGEQFGPEYVHTLTRISLDGRPIRDDDLADLSGLTKLQMLYLNGTPLSDAALAHLRSLTQLQVLELRETTIGDAGMSHLRGLKSLQALYLDRTRVGDVGLASLGGLTELRALHIGHSHITDAGMAHLAGLSKLQVLTLPKTRISDAGLAHLRGLTSLRSLDLDGTDITDQGLKHLDGLVELQVLFVGGSRVSDEGIRKFKMARPGVQVFYKPRWNGLPRDNPGGNGSRLGIARPGLPVVEQHEQDFERNQQHHDDLEQLHARAAGLMHQQVIDVANRIELAAN